MNLRVKVVPAFTQAAVLRAILFSLWLASILAAQTTSTFTASGYTLKTFAGTGKGAPFDGAAGAALSTQFGGLGGVTTDSSGNVYVSSALPVSTAEAIQEISNGYVSTLTENNPNDYSDKCDDGPYSGPISSLQGGGSPLTFDSAGNYYFANGGPCIVRVSGGSSGTYQILTNFHTASSYSTYNNNYVGVSGLAVDHSGTVFFSSNDQRGACCVAIYKISGNSIVEVLNQNNGLTAPQGIAFDTSNNLYIVDGARILRWSESTGQITTFAGSTNAGVQDGPVASATFTNPCCLALDSAGNIYVGDGNSNGGAGIVREITNGTVSTLQSNGGYGYSHSQVFQLGGIAVDPQGNVYFTDWNTQSVYELSPSGVSGNSAPTLVSLSPSSISAGSLAFVLTVNGTGFTNSSQVNWNGSSLPTAYLSATTLRAQVPNTFVSTAGTAAVTVTNPNAAASNSLTFTITAAGPVSTSLSPSSVTAGSGSVFLYVNGSGFAVGDTVNWNGVPLTSFLVAGGTSQMLGMVTAAQTSTPGTALITVSNTTGQVSNALVFTIAASGSTTTTSALQLQPLTPCRILDTRNANGAFGGPTLTGGTTRTISVPSSSCNVPSNSMAYSLNFTVIPRAGTLSSLTVWPAGTTQPGVSTLTSPDGSIIANAAIVPAGSGGSINVSPTQNADLIIDINGSFVPPSGNTLQFYPLTPCRVLDTRNAAGAFGGPSLVATVARSFAVPASGCGAPATAAAYSLNVTAVPQGPLGYITAWPTGQSQPYVSTLNSFDGTVLANAAIVPAGTGGAVSFFASQTADLVVDINGYFAPPSSSGLNFYTVTPCRVVNTLNASGSFGGPSLGALTTRGFPLPQGACGLPAPPLAQAYSLSITAQPQGPLGYLTVWPSSGSQPYVSTLNGFKGQGVANAALVPGGTNGSISIFVTNPANIFIDTAGYFGP